MKKQRGQFYKFLIIFCSLVTTIVWLTFFSSRDNEDPRVRQLNELQPNRTFSLYLKNNPLPFNLYYIDVIATAKKFNNKENLHPLILIGLSSRFVDAEDSLSLLKQINNKQFSPDSPVFLIKSKRSFVPSIQSIVNGNLKQLDHVLNYLLDFDYIKKVSILAFEESSLLLMRTFALYNIKNQKKISKIVLINIMNPLIYVAHQSSFYYNRQTSKLLSQNQTKLNFLNSLRIVIIETIADPYSRYQNYLLKPYDFFIQSIDPSISMNRFQTEVNFNLKNSVFIYSRFMRNILTPIKSVNYFALPVFSNTLVNFFHVDHHKEMNISEIQYFFLFKAQKDWNSYANSSLQSQTQCVQLENNFSQNQSLTIKRTEKCIKIFNSSKNPLNDSILIHGGHDYVIKDQEGQQIQFYEYSRSEKFYLIEKLKGSLFIVNKKGLEITIETVQTFSPDFNPFPIKKQKYSLVNICPGNVLVYPLNFQYSFWQHYLFVTQKIKQGATCYLDISNFDFLYAEILAKQYLIVNFVIFTLFCSHITNSSVFSKGFFIQFTVNFMLWIANESLDLRLALLGNLIVLVTAMSAEVILRIFVFAFSYAKIRRKYCTKIVWCPLWVQIARMLIPFSQPPFWHLFLITLPFVMTSPATVILFLELFLLKDYIIHNISNSSALFLMSCWLYIHLPNEQNPRSSQGKKLGFLVSNPWKAKDKQFEKVSKNNDSYYWYQTQKKILKKFPSLKHFAFNVGYIEYLDSSVALTMSIIIYDDFTGNLASLIKSYIIISLIMHIRQIIK